MSKKNRPSGNCPFCDTWRRSLHRDHIIPKWKGGSDDEENCQYICANCHEDKTREDLKGIRTRLGAVLSQETKDRITNANKGRIVPDDQKLKMSLAGKGRLKSDEHKAKIAAAHTGLLATISAKQNMSDSAKHRVVNNSRDVLGRFN